MPPKLPNKKTRQLLASITNKRARVVIQHILKRGFITTEALEKKYGYNHPPRAARDVREAGIPLETFRARSSDGRSIYWANPDEYSHIALREIRRADILWDEDEIQAYERLKKAAKAAQFRIPEHVKRIIAKHLDEP